MATPGNTTRHDKKRLKDLNKWKEKQKKNHKKSSKKNKSKQKEHNGIVASTYQKYLGLINLCCCVSVTVAVVVIMAGIPGIVYGINLVDDGKYLNNFKDAATLDRCLVTGTNTTYCERESNKPIGKIYKYTAIALEKQCAFKSVHPENQQCNIDYKPKEINNSYDCYVSECSDKQFSFRDHSGDDMIDQGKGWVIGCSVGVGISVLILAFAIWHCKRCCTKG